MKDGGQGSKGSGFNGGSQTQGGRKNKGGRDYRKANQGQNNANNTSRNQGSDTQGKWDHGGYFQQIEEDKQRA
jgi:hypothetical protein